MKKMLSFLLCIAMILCMTPTMAWAEGTVEQDSSEQGESETSVTGYNGETLPEAPTFDGDQIYVTPVNAQYTLDGAYGSIDGKTIIFTNGTYDVLELGRSTKFAGSNTIYYNGVWTEEDGWRRGEVVTDTKDLNANVRFYERTISDVVFQAEEGAKLAGFIGGDGHIYKDNYDYVKCLEAPGTGNSYYKTTTLNNLVFDGLTINGQWSFSPGSDYAKDTAIDGITFKNCTFTGNESEMNNNLFTAIRMQNNSRNHVKNVTVSGCDFTNYFQGIYIQAMDGVTIKNNTIASTKHNAIALQSSAAQGAKGTVCIEENVIKNAKDRAIRFGMIEANASVTIHNNIMIDSGDSDGELIKVGSNATDIAESAKIDLENNYWGGVDAEKAVNKDLPQPKTVGVNGGTFPDDIKADIKAYMVEGYTYVDNGDGTVTVKESKPSGGGYYPTAPTIQNPTIEASEGVTVTKGATGTTATITVADGYELVDVTVNGVSKGAVTTLTGLKTGDKVVVTARKIVTEPTVEEQIAAAKAELGAIDADNFYARSKVVTMKSGKKAVKVTWYTTKNADFDGVEIFRSVKRYSGYGTKPFFSTTKAQYYNTAIQSGTRYYYKVRGYRVVGGEKIYTGWSSKAWRTVK